MKQIEKNCGASDCFAQDTKITLADGRTTKRACDIRVGDRVRTKTGSATVQDIMVGMEQELIKIETTSRRSISLTEQHPLLMVNGPIVAEKVKIGDNLLMIDNHCDVVISTNCEPYGDRVYNFILEYNGDTENFIIANDFWIGDFNTQNSVQRRMWEERNSKA